MVQGFTLSDGFRLWLDKATRIDSETAADLLGEQRTAVDWSPHTLDYGLFKERLKFFARRRVKLQNLLRESEDHRVPVSVLTSILQPGAMDDDDTGVNSTYKSKQLAVIHSQDGQSPSISGASLAYSSRMKIMSLTSVASKPYPYPYLNDESPDQSGGMEDPSTDYVPYLDMMDRSGSSDVEDGSVGGGLGTTLQRRQRSDSSGGGRRGILGVGTSYRDKRKSKRSVMRRCSNAERQEMILFMSWEMDKVQMFYISQWQKLSQRLDEQQKLLSVVQRQQRNDGGIVDHSSTDKGLSSPLYDSPGYVLSNARLLGDEILELFAFCVVNIVTTRQMLIRYDAFARTFDGTPMLHYYMKKVKRHPTSFRKILCHEELQAIADAYMDCYSAAAITLTAVRHGQKPRDALATAGKEFTDMVENFRLQRNMFEEILNSSESAESVASTGHERLTDSFIHVVRNWYLLGAFEDRLGLEPSYLTMRGQSLMQEIQQLAEWRKKRHEATLIVKRNGTAAAGTTKRELSGMQVYHLTLNLISGFLYCMNYYIVEPSSAMYVSRLGAHDALAGTLIGMMPLAAFMSSIPFSMWTNQSFRHPFIMSCFLLIVGNLTYSLADRFGMVSIALAGRFICGLGAPKCIIRRYMADTTPVSLRTSVNAGFGMVVAAGSALGPAMAVILNKVEYTFVSPWIGFLYFNGLTLPGWFMASLWFTFTVIVLATFEEPDREGLAEQKALELQGAIPCSPSSTSALSPSGAASVAASVAHSDGDGVMVDLNTIFSGELQKYDSTLLRTGTFGDRLKGYRVIRWLHEVRQFAELITFPVRICLGLLFAKVFTIEALVSATSILTKNRYKWKVQQVGTLGFVNGLLVIPFSILVGRLSMSYQDHVLMKILLGGGCCGLFLLIDISDLISTAGNKKQYNKGNPLSVSPARYIAGYFLSYLSIQSFEGVIGSSLSKVIPTALASGTVNSGLLATLVDTFGRACGDLFISAMGYINLRQLMNLLFIPTFALILICLAVIQRYRDLLSV